MDKRTFQRIYDDNIAQKERIANKRSKKGTMYQKYVMMKNETVFKIYM